MIPLMIVSALSTGTSWYLKNKSLDETILAARTKDFKFDHETQLLSHIRLRDFIEKDFAPVPVNATLREMTVIIAGSKRNVFPVVGVDGTLVGIIPLEDIRDKMFDSSLYDKVTMDQLMRKPLALANVEEDMTAVMEKFDRFNVWNIPVVDEGKYVGFVSKSSIFTTYRQRLRRHDADDSQ